MQPITAHGMHMPKLGLGTFRMKGAECAEAVRSALELGYRHLDTAEMYDNEEAVGDAIASSGVPRADIHITTKVWWANLAPDAMSRAIETSLAKLRTDHVDLYLIHWPAADMDLAQTLHSLTRLQEQGLTRAIGVANFPIALMQRAAEHAPIACNQVEYHVLLGQHALVSAAQSLGVPIMAYAPLGQGRLAEHEELRAIAQKHGATPAQIALKWLLDQPGVGAIPKASRRESQQANLDALNITLDDTDRAAIAMLPKTNRFVNPGFAPAWDPVG
ncbi:MAG: aldo/keto reductase [Acetobacteraceae bacterium]